MGGTRSTAPCGRNGGRAAGTTTATGHHGYLALVNGGILAKQLLLHRQQRLLLLYLLLLLLFRLSQMLQLHSEGAWSRKRRKIREKRDERRERREREREMVYGVTGSVWFPKQSYYKNHGRAPESEDFHILAEQSQSKHYCLSFIIF